MTSSDKRDSIIDTQTWINNYLLMTAMINDSGNYHHCYHSVCETTTTTIPASSGVGGYSGGYIHGGSGGYSGYSAGESRCVDTGGVNTSSGGSDSGGGDVGCDF
ncbi:unnamed protein product [Ambrosiozyma monospora]|uniref:Unnamed protein product n=1 Tax=Ambrosiozyma monospora TaxID=43982 RepID=A0ACB5TVM6_AMBMO|nr:unnamed protein product [Ambrosiozyma monospora]